MDYRYIIFDFNGTLADSSDLMYATVAELIKGSRFKSITPKDFENPLELPTLKKIKVLVFTALYTRKFLQLYSKHLHKLKLVEGIKPMFVALNNKDYQYSILSSNSSDMILKFFAIHQIPIGSIYKSHRLTGKKKVIRKFIKDKGCKASDILYIGDEKRDVEVCNKCGVDIVFVKWGIGADEDLSGYKVKTVVMTPEELTRYLMDECRGNE